MPWHGPCPIPSSGLQMKATRHAVRVSRDEEQESSGILARVTIVLQSTFSPVLLYTPGAPKAHGPFTSTPQPSRAVLTE